ncbi:IS110 family transposase [Enterococcus durans]|uniref:IS110 family transposase n=1 Tax=Enterococcus durans TaxID=53345 RepID=UPI0018E05D72|nr:IS110 family transposase [Enterococcus durans]UQR07451.1 IS110 family transposase [Enterococcus durans]UQR07463.1 IS110 family transposase [Enterococcus durans]UQR07475.1 IS110 family transposase [Enterococcus durans]UQR07477.1 IS110 family transposase [Enterococcus durans]UQR07480.1 IS110 family transposase [Enterococcus durans]
MMYVLALDVSMGKSYVVIYHENTCLFEQEILHDKTHFNALLQEIYALPERPQIVFEATGVYSRVIETFCQKNHFAYCLLNPLEAKRQLNIDLRSVKTDKRDAHRLAQTHGQFLRKQKQSQTEVYKQTRDFARFYQQIERDIKRTRMNLHTALQLTFPELETLFTNRLSKLALNLVELFPHPDYLAHLSQTKVKNVLKKNTDKKISDQKALAKAQTLLSLAQNSYPAESGQSISVQKVVYYAQQLKQLLVTKEQLAKQLVDIAKQTIEFDFYQSIPGIGELSAGLIIGELGDIRRFSSHKQLNAFVGVDTRRYQSGKYTAKEHMNKHGNPKARKNLYFIMMNMIRQQAAGPNHLVDYYYKLKTQPSPKKHKVALVACINKLLKCLHSMVRHSSPYDYSYTASNDQ